MHSFKKTEIEWHKDGSCTICHIHSDGPQNDVKHAASDLDGAHDSLEEHIGDENDGESSDENGKGYED